MGSGKAPNFKIVGINSKGLGRNNLLLHRIIPVTKKAGWLKKQGIRVLEKSNGSGWKTNPAHTWGRFGRECQPDFLDFNL